MNQEPFNLEQFKQGRKAPTRDGRIAVNEYRRLYPANDQGEKSPVKSTQPES